MALAKVGILSIGDMGFGVAKLLKASGFEVLTNVTGRRYVSSKVISERISLIRCKWPQPGPLFPIHEAIVYSLFPLSTYIFKTEAPPCFSVADN